MLLVAPFISGAEQQTLSLCGLLARRTDCRLALLVNAELYQLIQSSPHLTGYLAGTDVVRLGPAFAGRRVGGWARHLPLPLRVAYYARLVWQVGQALRAWQPHVVHLLLVPSFAVYAPLFSVLPFPVVVTVAGEMRYRHHRMHGRGRCLLVEYAIRRADAVIACSVGELRYLERYGLAPPERTVLLDNFTDSERFRPAEEKQSLVVYAARFHYEKNPLLFVQSAAVARAAAPAARFLMLGRGELEPEVRAGVERLALRDCLDVEFAQDVTPVLARSSVFVSCQRYENLGSSSLLEAMACENAVVATDVGHTWQIVDDRVGQRVPAEPQAVGAAVAGLLADPGRARRLGAAARARVLERYSPEIYLPRVLEVYEAAARRRRSAKSQESRAAG